MAVGDKIITSTDLGEHVMQTSSRTSGAELEILQKVGSTTGVITTGVDIFDVSTNVTTDNVRLVVVINCVVPSGNTNVSIASKITINNIDFLISDWNGTTATQVTNGETVFATFTSGGQDSSDQEFTLPETLTQLSIGVKLATSIGPAASEWTFQTFIEGVAGFIGVTSKINFISGDYTGGVSTLKEVDILSEFLINLPSIYST